jgi:hypothetical protein
MLGFVVGTAIIALPRGNVALLATVGAVKVGKVLLRRVKNGKRKGSKAALAPAAADAANEEVEPVRLQWSALTCKLQTAKGPEKVILDGITGEASPGR